MSDEHQNIIDYLDGQHLVARRKRLKESAFRLLEIASNCSVPGESSSRTIERAEEFKKYINEASKDQ